MKTFFSEDHRLHFPQGELSGGELVTPYERPSRVEFVLAELRARGMPTPRTRAFEAAGGCSGSYKVGRMSLTALLA